MYLKNKILLSSGMIWVVFLFMVYVGAQHYLLPSLLHVESGGHQEIIINQYAFNQIINSYLMIVMFIGLLLGGLAGYFLYVVFTQNENILQRLHYAMANKEKEVAELYKKISMLEQRAEKADRVDNMLHSACDLLNSLGTSVSLAKEKIENSSAEKLTDLVMLLAQHQNNLGEFIMNDAQGQQVPSYLAVIAKMWVDENNYLVNELALLDSNFNKINHIIKTI
jgi:dsDNA-binding SOS-regulon protein